MFVIILLRANSLNASQLKACWSQDSSITAVYVDTNETFNIDVWLTGNTEPVNGAAVFLTFSTDSIFLKSVVFDTAIFGDTLKIDTGANYLKYMVLTNNDSISSQDVRLFRMTLTSQLSGSASIDFYFANDTTNRQSAVTVYNNSNNSADTYISAVLHRYIPRQIFITYPVLSGNRYDTVVNEIALGGTSLNGVSSDSIIVRLSEETVSMQSYASANWSATSPVNLANKTVQILIRDMFGHYSSDTFLLAPGYIIYGKADLTGISNDSGVNITITKDTFSYSAISNDSGDFILRSLAFDTYQISLKKIPFKDAETYLYVNSDTIILPTINLVGGDFFKDNSINIKDIAFVKKYYGQSMPQYDIDGDGIIGPAEKNLIILNFEK